LLRIKQIYVLAGQLVEEYLQNQMSLTGINRTTMLGQLAAEDMVLIESIWHSAEAYHFYILAQRQLRSGL
jgi:WD repeat-containing protein 35